MNILYIIYLTYIVSVEENMKPLKERISVTIDSDLLQELKNEAERDERSLSQFINLVLRKYIREKDEE